MINYAHRGASEYAPENTMASFCLGIELGANGIETDVRQTRDGVLVLCHDATMKRTAGVDAAVREMTWAELARLDVGSYQHPRYAGERVVRLEDFLYYFGGKPLRFAIEIKQPGVELDTLALLRRYLTDDRFTITSFQLNSLLACAKATPKPRLGCLSREFSEALLDKLQSEGIEEFCPDAAWLTEEMAEAVRRRGMGLRAWGVRDQELMRRMVRLQVDGMTVNFPDKLAAMLL